MPGAVCGMPVGEAPSAGRLTSKAIAPPAPDDPCILPPASGYRGLENRLYRVEVVSPLEKSYSAEATRFLNSFKLLREARNPGRHSSPACH